MALPRLFSMNANLRVGMTDGTYADPTPDRGGAVEGTTQAARMHLSDWYYDIHEAPHKVLPDGRG